MTLRITRPESQIDRLLKIIRAADVNQHMTKWQLWEQTTGKPWPSDQEERAMAYSNMSVYRMRLNRIGQSEGWEVAKSELYCKAWVKRSLVD